MSIKVRDWVAEQHNNSNEVIRHLHNTGNSALANKLNAHVSALEAERDGRKG